MAPRNLLYQTPYADDEWWQGGLEGTETARAAALPWDAEQPSNGRRTDYFSSPVQLTGGFGPEAYRTPLTARGQEMARRPPGDLGSSYSNQPLTGDPTPQDRLGNAIGLADATQRSPAPAIQAAGATPSGFGGQPSSAPGPPGGQAPSLTGQPAQKSLWRRGVDYLNEPAFPRDEFGQEKPMSRGNMIGEMLMGAGQAIGTSKAGTGMLMAGLGGANQARQQARAAEEQRTQEATNNWYKRISGQAAMANALKAEKGSTSEFERTVESLIRAGKITPERGQDLLLQRSEALATEKPAAPARTAEGVLMDPGATPEQRAEAERVFKLKQQPDPMELANYELARGSAARAEEASRMAAGTFAAAREEGARRAQTEGYKAEGDLRKEYSGLDEVKRYNAVLPAIRSAYVSAGNNDRIADLDLVYALGKAFDPNSVVREGEQDAIARSQSLPESFKGKVLALLGGQGRLQPEVRQQMLRTLQDRARALEQSAKLKHEEYRGHANAYRYDANRAVPGLEGLPELPLLEGASDAAAGATPATQGESRDGVAPPELSARYPQPNEGEGSRAYRDRLVREFDLPADQAAAVTRQKYGL